MIGSTYSPQRWSDVEANKIQPNIIGIQALIAFGGVRIVDTLVSDDSLIRGIQFLAKTPVFGDLITIKVADVDGIYAPAGTVISTPVSNFNLAADAERQADYESIAPFKILGGLYVRIIYTSTGSVDVTVGANLIFEKVLV